MDCFRILPQHQPGWIAENCRHLSLDINFQVRDFNQTFPVYYAAVSTAFGVSLPRLEEQRQSEHLTERRHLMFPKYQSRYFMQIKPTGICISVFYSQTETYTVSPHFESFPSSRSSLLR